jgi:hypothetical protein
MKKQKSSCININPWIQLKFIKETLMVAIMMDFIIERLGSNQRDTIKRHLYDTKTILCCSKEYLANNKIVTLPEDLQKHRYITNSNRLQQNQVKLENNLIIIN